METNESQPRPEELLAEEVVVDESEAESESEVAGTSATDGELVEMDELTDEVSIEALQTQLAEQCQQSQDYLDQLQRLQAEFTNYRRRMAQERSQAAARGKEELLLSLLPVLSNLHLAVQHADQDANSVRQGVQMIWQQCADFLRQHGVEAIETVGQPFDPALHEALTTAPATEETPANTIVAEINPGYRLNGQLLRAAQVIVAQAESESEPEDPSTDSEDLPAPAESEG